MDTLWAGLILVLLILAFAFVFYKQWRDDLEYAFKDWWEDSIFNSFKVIDKFKKVLEHVNQYWLVVKQVKTGHFYEIQVSVDMYYRSKIGDVVSFTKKLLDLDYLSDLALCKEQQEAYNNEVSQNKK